MPRAKVPQSKLKRISTRGVLEPEELKFCQLYLAFGKRDIAEAYRRSHLRKTRRGVWVDVLKTAEATQDQVDAGEPVLPQECSRRGKQLLDRMYIIEALAEMQRTPSEHARQALADNLLFGSSAEKKDAISRVFSEEDKLGFRDAVEQWADIMCDIGSEVVFPLGVVKREVRCAHCKETNEVEIDLAIEVPLSEFFQSRQNANAESAGRNKPSRVLESWRGGEDQAPPESRRPLGRPRSTSRSLGVPEGSSEEA